ncbi:TetR/AcrR family transcriptional regulator [Tengunoibacter tsumagoiensis]|uniref:HTH tetR-type domain-containing protein n=1 Tax=Tengunoibacter tsumagoiensis TaxID=2014871 RepID=A0A402A2B0_9CHLR|nr:TetR/AcrR family transcriptional regulator [Tengunoibacter tsumagoiensis]GCE13280.1 hypothetical protein KTT_31390 [Tengunoibacter tsumagoiensis]
MGTRQQILEATERVIQQLGIARVTTKEIAREAGCAEGTLYKHFEHKEDLFLQVLQENLPEFVLALHDHQPGQRTVQENLLAIAEAAFLYYTQLTPLAASFFADTELLTRHRTWMDTHQIGPQRLPARVAEYIQQEQQLGRITPQLDPLTISHLLLGPCFQLAFNYSFLGTPRQPHEASLHLKSILEVLVSGLIP